MTTQGRDSAPGCESSVSDDQMTELLDDSVESEVATFAALANETRFRILLIADAADRKLCGCDLEPHLDVGQSSISQALSRLREADLLTRTKDGRWRYYEPTPKAERILRSVDCGTPAVEPPV